MVYSLTTVLKEWGIQKSMDRQLSFAVRDKDSQRSLKGFLNSKMSSKSKKVKTLDLLECNDCLGVWILACWYVSKLSDRSLQISQQLKELVNTTTLCVPVNAYRDNILLISKKGIDDIPSPLKFYKDKLLYEMPSPPIPNYYILWGLTILTFTLLIIRREITTSIKSPSSRLHPVIIVVLWSGASDIRDITVPVSCHHILQHT